MKADVIITSYLSVTNIQMYCKGECVLICTTEPTVHVYTQFTGRESSGLALCHVCFTVCQWMHASELFYICVG